MVAYSEFLRQLIHAFQVRSTTSYSTGFSLVILMDWVTLFPRGSADRYALQVSQPIPELFASSFAVAGPSYSLAMIDLTTSTLTPNISNYGKFSKNKRNPEIKTLTNHLKDVTFEKQLDSSLSHTTIISAFPSVTLLPSWFSTQNSHSRIFSPFWTRFRFTTPLLTISSPI